MHIDDNPYREQEAQLTASHARLGWVWPDRTHSNSTRPYGLWSDMRRIFPIVSYNEPGRFYNDDDEEDPAWFSTVVLPHPVI